MNPNVEMSKADRKELRNDLNRDEKELKTKKCSQCGDTDDYPDREFSCTNCGGSLQTIEEGDRR